MWPCATAHAMSPRGEQQCLHPVSGHLFSFLLSVSLLLRIFVLTCTCACVSAATEALQALNLILSNAETAQAPNGARNILCVGDGYTCVKAEALKGDLDAWNLFTVDAILASIHAAVAARHRDDSHAVTPLLTHVIAAVTTARYSAERLVPVFIPVAHGALIFDFKAADLPVARVPATSRVLEEATRETAAAGCGAYKVLLVRQLGQVDGQVCFLGTPRELGSW
eukprot:CAMPEP_0167816810 /NCGR_PEP_ID=MMETSP0112_2-20121227/3831_1 /TAXON_ID=91324 /ORGANISM="Lotharella globosa, Strain CCCM811" /LENGTH=223 /DNA_ID=CAMNT_0007716475 /DNA_START=40 /DNA_END=708 /DNA_ORIENTATION=-